MKSGSNLEKVLCAGKFAVTAELGPPRGSNIEVIKKKGLALKGHVDAVNITDNQTAIVKMSSIAAGSLLCSLGIEPVIQMVTRDRNRIAMQSDILGASALGIKNILCLSGDHQTFGNQKFCKNVYDIDSIQLISAVRGMRDEAKILDSEDELDGRIDMFIGAAAAPFADPMEFRPLRLKKKVDAGADFIQTQCIYDVSGFKEYMKKVCDLGLHEKCYILAGIMPLKSMGMANFMAKCVPGVVIPEEKIKRMKGLSGEKAAREGIEMCTETIQEIKEIDGVSGIHLMAIEWEHRVEEILTCAGLVSREL